MHIMAPYLLEVFLGSLPVGIPEDTTVLLKEMQIEKHRVIVKKRARRESLRGISGLEFRPILQRGYHQRLRQY
jgi:hypothetical protein